MFPKTAVVGGRLGETPLPPRGKSIAPNRGLPRPEHRYNSKTRKTAQFGISVIHRFRMTTQRRPERRDTAYSPRVPEEEPSGDGMLLPSLLKHRPHYALAVEALYEDRGHWPRGADVLAGAAADAGALVYDRESLDNVNRAYRALA